MTLKNNRAPLLCYFNLCASFHSQWWIQTGVTVQKQTIWVKIDDFFLAVWPWNLTDDLEEQYGTSSKQHQALCIISSPYVNSNWSYGPETAKWGHDLCDFDLWPWPFAWTSCLSMVITPENFRMIRWQEHCHKGVTDGQMNRHTDGETEIGVLRAAWSQLKIGVKIQHFPHFCSNIGVGTIQIFKRPEKGWSKWGSICSNLHRVSYPPRGSNRTFAHKIFLADDCSDASMAYFIKKLTQV